jgi:lipopolysaccharide export system permease protein
MRLARTLSTYIARQFIAWCGAVFGSMLAIIFLLDYIELIRRGGSKPEATLGLLLEMAALKLPHMAQEVLPFAVLFGAMMAFWRLTRSNELVIARSAGVSVWQFLMPAVVFALLIGIAAVTVFNPVSSAMEASYEALENRVLRGGGNDFALFRSGLWLREADADGNQTVVHADRMHSGKIVLENVTMFFFEGKDRFAGRIDAAEARLEGGSWHLRDVWRSQKNGSTEHLASALVPTRLTTRKIEESFASPETMSFWKLPGYIRLLADSGFATQRHRLYFNALLAKPLLLCAMVLIAATFSLRMQRRGGATIMIVGGVGTGFLLYFLSDVVFALGLSSTIPVALAAWTPAGVCLLLGVTLLLHLEDG